MDIIDKKIATQLQKNARITHKQIGIEMDLPTSTVNDRVRHLIKNGTIKHVIKVYHIKAKPVILAYISVPIDWSESKENLGLVVRNIPEVIECHSVTGDWSYLLKVRARDNAHLEDIISNQIKAFRGVTRSETIFVLDTVKETTELPLDVLD
mgnify:CR=1 FL=1